MKRGNRIDFGDRCAEDELRELLYAARDRFIGAGDGERIRDVRAGDADVVESAAEGRVQRRSLTGRIDDDRRARAVVPPRPPPAHVRIAYRRPGARGVRGPGD